MSTPSTSTDPSAHPNVVHHAANSWYRTLLARLLGRRNITVWILGLMLGGIFILLGLDLKSSYKYTQESAHRDAEHIVKLIEREVNHVLTKSDLILQEAVRTYSKDMNKSNPPSLEKRAEINQKLLYLMNNIPETQKDSLRLIDSDGNVMFNAGSTAELPKVYVGDRNYFLRQKTETNAGLVVSEPLLSRFTGKWLVVLSQRMNHPDGSFAGVAQVAVRADALQQTFERISLDSQAAITLFDSEVRLVSRHPLIPDQLGKQFASTQLQEAFAKGWTRGEYDVSSRVDGVFRHHIYHKVEAAPFVVVIGISPTEYLRNWYTKVWLYGISLVAITLLVLILLYTLKGAEQEKTIQLQERFARKTAEETLAIKSRLLDVISHELRTPMNGVMGVIQLLEMTDLSKEQRHYLQIAKESGSSLMEMVAEILEYAQLESGQVKMVEEEFVPGLVLDEAAASLFNRLRDKHLDFACDISSMLHLPAIGDPSHLKHVIQILTDNAIKFTEKGSVRIVANGEEDTKSNRFILHWTITDTGIGIAEAKQAELFSPFSQGDDSSTRKHGGTGMGLAIAGSLIRHMGGTIDVSSKLGEGSSFHFAVPLKYATLRPTQQ